jgi:hypothetical protein
MALNVKPVQRFLLTVGQGSDYNHCAFVCVHVFFLAFLLLTLALAAAAFFARAVRSAGVMEAAAAGPPILPPILPPLRPISLKYSAMPSGSFFRLMSNSLKQLQENFYLP